MDNLKEKTARGLLWGGFSGGITQVLGLVIGIFLARLLSPGDYGIVGVLAIFTALAGNLQSSGFSQGLINIKNPTPNDYNSVFWFNISMSAVLYAVLFFSAPLLAAFFHQPVLVGVSRLVFLSFFISSFGIVQNVYMMKNMMQREMAVCSVLALAVSGIVGVLLAWQGYAYWSLAWQQVIYCFVMTFSRYYYTDWRPTLHFDMTPVRRMFGFSVKILLTYVVTTLGQNMLTFFFGRLFPIHVVGNYSQANKWNTMAHATISSALGQVVQPVMISVDDEPGRELRVFRKMLRFTAFVSFPSLFGLALVSREFILLLLGSKWEETIPLLRVLCVGGAFLPFYMLYQNMALSIRRSDLYLWCGVSQIVAQLAAILLLYRQGVFVIVCAYTVLNILWAVVWQWVAGKPIGLRWRDALADTMPFLLVAAATMTVTWVVTQWLTHLVLLLLARVVVAAALYFIVLKCSHAHILEESLQYLKHRRP